jgi:hypothetical protein
LVAAEVLALGDPAALGLLLEGAAELGLEAGAVCATSSGRVPGRRLSSVQAAMPRTRDLSLGNFMGFSCCCHLTSDAEPH